MSYSIVRMHFYLFYPFLFEFNFAMRTLPLFLFYGYYYLHSSHITFIGLLPRFIFFAKVPFRYRDVNHFHRTSFNKFPLHCRLPSVGIYVYVGVSSSFLVFLEATQIISVYLLFSFIRFFRSTETLSEYIPAPFPAQRVALYFRFSR